MDIITAFLAGWAVNYLLTPFGFVVFLLIGAFVEHRKGTGFAVFAAIVWTFISVLGVIAVVEPAGSVQFVWSNLLVDHILYYTVGYGIIGIVWSVWRYRKHVKTQHAYIMSDSFAKQFHGGHDRVNSYRVERLEALAPLHQMDNIVCWIIIWPFSLLENLVGDLYDLLAAFVSRVCIGMYRKLYNAIVGDDVAKLKAATASKGSSNTGVHSFE